MKLTDARRRALLVLVDARRQGRPARESNATDPARRSIYWQVVEWLLDEGLVKVVSASSSRRIELTPAGVEVCRAEGIGSNVLGVS